MRTTITLDDDLVARLRQIAHEQGIPFKDVLNGVLRRGLEARAAARRFTIRPARLRLRPGIDLEKALRLAVELEDAETIRKLELRK